VVHLITNNGIITTTRLSYTRSTSYLSRFVRVRFKLHSLAPPSLRREAGPRSKTDRLQELSCSGPLSSASVRNLLFCLCPAPLLPLLPVPRSPSPVRVAFPRLLRSLQRRSAPVSPAGGSREGGGRFRPISASSSKGSKSDSESSPELPWESTSPSAAATTSSPES
jgi:hypothetical protein